MSVQLRIGDGLLHIADEFPEMGVLAPPSIGGFWLSRSLTLRWCLRRRWRRAQRFVSRWRRCSGVTGTAEDPFGHRWNIAEHLRDVPHDEVVLQPHKRSAE